MSDIKRLFSYIAKNKFPLLFSVAFALIFVICLTLTPLFTGYLVDEIKCVVENKASTLNDTNFYKYLLIIFILIILSVLFQFLFDLLINNTMEKISKEMKNDAFEKILKVPLKYIDNHTYGELVSLIINDIENINNALISTLKQLYQGIVQVLFTLIIMLIFNWILALLILVLTPLTFLITYTIAKKSKESFKKQTKIFADMGGIVLESFNNIDVLKSFNYEDKSYKIYEEKNNELYKAGQKAQFISSFTNPFTRLINNSIYAFVGLLAAILCVIAKDNPNNMLLGASCKVGTIITFIQFTNQFAKPFNEISSCISELQTGLSSLKRLNRFLNEKDDVNDGKLTINEEINDIDFNHLYFSYKKSTPLINDFNLHISKGKKIAIVGPTGCGKTTLINLLMRFYDPIEGSIDFNNIDTRKIKKESLRSQFNMVLQDTWIFNGTVRENIIYGKANASEEEIIEACKKADCYDFIMHLGNGLDTKISDTSGLSIGQKQLISIVRIFLSLKNLVILDEATSNVDTRTEIKISNAFNKIKEGKTSFVIAHRLSTIVNSDLIIVMKNGEIIETGKHEELLKKKGFYFELFNAQYDTI